MSNGAWLKLARYSKAIICDLSTNINKSCNKIKNTINNFLHKQKNLLKGYRTWMIVHLFFARCKTIGKSFRELIICMNILVRCCRWHLFWQFDPTKGHYFLSHHLVQFVSTEIHIYFIMLQFMTNNYSWDPIIWNSISINFLHKYVAVKCIHLPPTE